METHRICCHDVATEGDMPRKKLTDRTLQALKPKTKPYDLMDSELPGLGVRVMASGQRSFILVGRFPGSRNPTRRRLGVYPVLTLADAREKAADWRKLIGRGIDPELEEERARQAEACKRANSFAAVAEDFIAEKLPSERKGAEITRDIRREFIALWGKRPISEITDLDVLAVIKAKARTAPIQGHNILATVKRLLSWAVDQRCYGLKASPAADLKASKIIGEKARGERVLNDDDLFALWRAATRTPYPHGPVYKLLMLSGLRLNEVADASWPEIDERSGVWVIPSQRMKGRNGKVRPHAVPLTADIKGILDQLPRFKSGEYVFSTRFGKSPVWIGEQVKKRVDRRMLRTLRALARRRGEDPARVRLVHWTNHDIRRTVRTRLSRLKITEEAREAVLAHVRPGIKGTYDHHDYLDEKREALDLWAARLRSIVEPVPAANVIQMRA
jgi:integrase